MSKNARRSSRLQDKRIKLAANVRTARRKSNYKILDDDSTPSSELADNSPDDEINDSVTSSNTSFTRRSNPIGSKVGNFTRVYSSYCKETNLAAALDTYENDFIDDGDSYDSDSAVEEDRVIKEDSFSDQSIEEDDNRLHTSYDRKRKGRFGGDSSSEESSDSVILAKKKKRRIPLRSSSRAVSLKEKKEADKIEKLQELKRTRERKRAGLRIEALEVEQKEEEKEDSTNEQTISDSEEDAKFVVSDDEAIDQPSDFEHSNDDLHLTLKPSMSTKLFSSDHIAEVKEQLLKTLKRRKSIDCIELLKVVEEGDLRKIDAFMEQLREFYNNIDLYSTVAHLVLQLSICYDHSSIVEPLINQYKIDPNRSDHRGIIPLTLAAAYGHYECFKILLHHTELQSILAEHPTLLHVVVEMALSNEANDDHSYHIMKLLFQEKREFFDQMMSSSDHPTIIEMVIWFGRVMCLAFLLKNYAEAFESLQTSKNKMEEFPPSLIILAICSPCQQGIGNSLILQLLLEHEIGNIDMSDSKGWTGLMWSTYYKNTDCMQTLLDHNATVYCRDEHGSSCLHIAALLGATKCAQLLINHRHPIDCTDDKGWPPLLYANFSSERECVLAIMKAKPNQLLILGKLLEKSCDVESEAKQRTYLQVQKVLEAVAQHEAYYAVFNQFICDNPDILIEEGGDSTFLQKCKDLLDFNNKKKWFYKMLEDMKKFTPPDYRSDYYGYTTLYNINRESVMLTAYRRLRYTSPSSLRMNFSVTFRNEPGIAAGPRREFWSCFSQDVVKKDHHLLKKCDNSHYTFIAHQILKCEKNHRCSSNIIKEDNLDLLKFIGKMLAVAVNYKDVISFRLAHPILKMLLGMQLVHPDDMEAIDGEYYQNFHSFDGDISELGLSFSDLLYCPVCGNHESFDLPTSNGNKYNVTENNKADFIKAVSIFKLQYSIKKEIVSFLKGFWEVIPVEYLRIFNPDQFSLLLSGVPTIDVDDWEQNTEYTFSSTKDTDCVIGWFWSLVRGLAEEEKALLLKFCTGSPRVPAGGFANLEGLSGLTKFRISFDSGQDRVPEASTCFNNLRLSHYTNEQQCRDKILIAVRFGCEGFSFS